MSASTLYKHSGLKNNRISLSYQDDGKARAEVALMRRKNRKIEFSESLSGFVPLVYDQRHFLFGRRISTLHGCFLDRRSIGTI